MDGRTDGQDGFLILEAVSERGQQRRRGFDDGFVMHLHNLYGLVVDTAQLIDLVYQFCFHSHAC